VVDGYPSSAAGAALKELAARADTFDVPRIPSGGPTFFVERLLATMPASSAAGAA
jgi:hypothetical protein